jgi:hypothetical protein
MRLNAEQVRRLRPDNPEIDRLLYLADGMMVPVAADFEPDALMPKQARLRPRYRRDAGGAAETMLMATRMDCLAFVLPPPCDPTHTSAG